MEAIDAVDDLDDPTQPFTHSEIGRLLNEAERAPVQREYEVDLSYFFHFGEGGTPSGMTGSHTGPVAAGSCGAPPRVKPRPPQVPPRPPGPAAPPVAEFYSWGPAPGELGGELPGAELETPLPWTLAASIPPPPAVEPSPREAPHEQSNALEEDLRGAGLRSRVGLVVGGAIVLAAGLATLWWRLTLPEPPPPPAPRPPEQVEMVVTDYEDVQFEVQSEDLGGSETGQVMGRVEVDGPSNVAEIPAWKTMRCTTQRDQAAVAARDGRWARLEVLSRETKCWRPTREAKVLRMHALFELGRFDECTKVGGGATHPEIEKWTNLCSLARG
jgi:hypothetical protein